MQDTTKIDIKKYLSQFSGQEVIYVPNPGNAGDSLIAYATIQIMQEIGIIYKIESSNETFKDKIIFYGGGGNFVPTYNVCANFVRRNHKDNRIIVLPHTISGHENVLEELSEKTVLICREQISLNYIKSMTNATSYLSDDLALYTKIPDHLKNNKMGITGYCFRIDKEKTNKDIPIDNKDFSSLLAFRMLHTEEKIKYAASIFLNTLSVFDIIHTNRLHIAIAGILLEQQVYFYPNSYYKCRAVFDNSIKNKYTNAIWRDE